MALVMDDRTALVGKFYSGRLSAYYPWIAGAVELVLCEMSTYHRHGLLKCII